MRTRYPLPLHSPLLECASSVVPARWSLAAALLFGLTACGGASRTVPRLAEVERARSSPAAAEGKALAPQAFAQAEEERTRAEKAHEGGDDLAAQLHADHAMAGYDHAFILARLARATRELAGANASLGAATEQARTLSAARVDVEREGADLEKKLIVLREVASPMASGKTDARREAARLVAARLLVTEAHLLCSSARLLSEGAPGLADAEKELTALEAQVDGSPKTTPIDAAARVRARCLDVLTRARRTAKDAAPTDALLGEISAAAGFDPTRDERGVVVTLRDVFRGETLTPEADARLRELGRVAAAHPGVAVQIVLHDGAPPAKGDASLDGHRADAAAKAVVTGGIPSAKVKPELAGVRAPIVDPTDAEHRGRNARLDVVFVSPGE